jgi:hypothetical protein
MRGKIAVAITTAVVVVCLGFRLTDAVAETGFGDSRGAEFGSVAPEAGGGGWRRRAWNGGDWEGAGWRDRGWSWDSVWGWGWPAPAAAWYYGPYDGACRQPQWTGNGWVWVNVC